MKTCRQISCRSSRGQTVLELAFFSLWFAGFFVLTAYMFKAFDISQKQTMLVRNQAFMELGNFSDYGYAKHGEDDIKDKRSQLTFALGEKTSGTRVDFDKIEVFKKAVSGNLTVDVTRSTTDDRFWNSFGFPKANTRLVWLENKYRPTVEMNLVQHLAIAHNRSVKLSGSFFAAKNTNGLFSGSIHINDFAKLSGMADSVKKGMGLIDNLTLLREQAKKLVKDNPSLSDEAAKLEDSLNSADGLSSGAAAALISAALQYALQYVMKYAGEAMKGGKAAGDGVGSAAKSGGQASGPLSGFGSAAESTQAFFKGTLLEGPMTALTQPIVGVTQGLASFTSGMASGQILQSGGALSGLSTMGQSASIGMGYAGVNIAELNMASTAAGIPGSIDAGITGFRGAIHNTGTSGVGDYIGALSQIVSPITSLVSMIAPEAAMPLSYVNSGLAAAGSIVNTVNGIGKIEGDIGKKPIADVLQDVGAFTMGVGGLYGMVAGITGNDATPALYITMAGGGLLATGTLIKTAEDMKAQGLNMANPVDTIKYAAEKNVEGVKNSWNSFETKMTTASDKIRTSTADIFSKGKKIDNPEATSVVNGVKKLEGVVRDPYDNMIVGTNKDDLSKANLTRAGDNLQQMKAALTVNMGYHGASEEKLAAMQSDFKEVENTIGNLDSFKRGKSELDGELLTRGNAAVNRLNDLVANYVQQDPSKKTDGSPVAEFAPDQLKAMLARQPNSQKTLELTAINNKETFDTQKQMEKDLASQGGLKGTWFSVKAVTGGNRTLNADRAQQQKIADLVTLANAKQSIDHKISETKTTVKAVQTAEGISMFGPIASNDPQMVRENAAKLSSQLSRAMKSDAYSTDMKARMSVQIDKLNAIAGGERQIISERQWLRDSKAKVDDVAKTLKAEKQRWAEISAGGCSESGC